MWWTFQRKNYVCIYADTKKYPHWEWKEKQAATSKKINLLKSEHLLEITDTSAKISKKMIIKLRIMMIEATKLIKIVELLSEVGNRPAHDELKDKNANDLQKAESIKLKRDDNVILKKI